MKKKKKKIPEYRQMPLWRYGILFVASRDDSLRTPHSSVVGEWRARGPRVKKKKYQLFRTPSTKTRSKGTRVGSAEGKFVLKIKKRKLLAEIAKTINPTTAEKYACFTGAIDGTVCLSATREIRQNSGRFTIRKIVERHSRSKTKNILPTKSTNGRIERSRIFCFKTKK